MGKAEQPDLLAGLSERLRRLREHRGWSQAELSRRSEVMQNSISRFEQGGGEQRGRVPQLDALIKIADAYGISLDELVGRESTPQSDGGGNPKLVELLNRAKELPNADLDWVLAIIEAVERRRSQ